MRISQNPGLKGAAAAGMVLAVAISAPASADLKLCNFTDARVGVAIGFKDEKGWVTEGWWNILARGCVVVLPGELKSRYFYVHAVDYDRGGEWSGPSPMCVDDKSFAIRDIKNCEPRGYKQSGFYEVDTGDSKDYTIRLSDPVKKSEGNQ